jgi:partner of Y14 and mago protein
MPTSASQPVTKSGIKTKSDGTSIIPSSKRADGSTRKEIRIRPGYKPPEDVETYKNRSAESWKSRGTGGVPGAEPVSTGETENKSKNAKRREAARRKAQENAAADDDETSLTAAMQDHNLNGEEKAKEDGPIPGKPAEYPPKIVDEEAEKQKKIRNLLKKLRAVRELKEKKSKGEKLSHDQIMKMSKEPELVRDLQKLNYDGPELDEGEENPELRPAEGENGTEPD